MPELTTGVSGGQGGPTGTQAGRTDGTPIGSESAEPAKPIRRDAPKVGRNEPCPCGSGKKYKKCHGAVA